MSVQDTARAVISGARIDASAFWSVCDILRRSNCAGAMQYVPELTWLLFLRILDEREAEEALEAAVGQGYTPSLEAPYRWRDWAAPNGARRQALTNSALNAFLGFVNGELLPYLRGLSFRPNATPRQKVIGQIMSGVERTRVDTETNLLNVLDRIDALHPPFGGKESKEAQTNFDYRTGATQVLFLQHVLKSLQPGGRCGIVLDEGVLFRTNETAFVQTKRKLLDDCDLWCIVSLPAGVFTAAGAGVKTNLIFFTKGQPTERIWYFDLSDVKVGKKSPFTLKHFEDAGFFDLLPQRADSDRSWTVPRADIEARNYDLKAVNPHARVVEDTRTPAELLDLIEAKGHEVTQALADLRRLTSLAE